MADQETSNEIGKPVTDGRRRRSERSRGRIVEAMLALIRAGDHNPSAAAVADKAKVSLRTVFRRFDDMDGLYAEMVAIMEDELTPQLIRPYRAKDWPGRLRELLSRRAEIYEQIMPIRYAADLRRPDSPYLTEHHRRVLAMERAGLEAVLPPHIADDEVLFAAIEMACGFPAWRRLRMEQKLSPDRAERVLQLTIDRLAGW